jgi:hypothetical protein
MSKRLQVLLDEEEFDDLRAAASRQGMPVSEWVRQAIREARGREPGSDVEAKLRAIRRAVKHEQGPAADIEQMNAEIEQGYLSGLP